MLGDRSASKDARLGAALTVAIEITKYLHDYTRLASPPRPTALEDEHEQSILDKLKFLRHTTRAISNDDKDYVTSFADWRYACFLVEARNAGRVECLAYAWRTLAKVAPEHEAHQAQLDDLLTFLGAEWGVDVNREPPAHGEARGIAAWVAQDLQTLPLSLRNMDDFAPRKKRGGDPSPIGAVEVRTSGRDGFD